MAGQEGEKHHRITGTRGYEASLKAAAGEGGTLRDRPVDEEER